MTGLGLAIGSCRNGFDADFFHLGASQGGYNEDHEFLRLPDANLIHSACVEESLQQITPYRIHDGAISESQALWPY